MEIGKLEIHHYTLQPRIALNRLATGAARSGALLRIWFAGCANPGHADLFPWVELGDLPLRLQLETLKERTPLPLAAASVLWAFEEAKARDKDVCLITPVDIPSHVTLLERDSLPSDTATAKIKITPSDITHWRETEAFLQKSPATRWRLDFNGLFSDLVDARTFWSNISESIKSRIDFLEDPVSESLMGHPQLRSALPGARIAVDRSNALDALKNADIRVLKPVTFSPDVLVSDASDFPGEIVVTSMMDHPLGQIIALRGAQLIQKAIGPRMLTAGLLTHELYQPHAASSWVKTDGAFLRPQTRGAGWGLENQLNNLHWEELV